MADPRLCQCGHLQRSHRPTWTLRRGRTPAGRSGFVRHLDGYGWCRYCPCACYVYAPDA